MIYASKNRRKIDWAHLAGLLIVLAGICLIVFLGYKIITKERVPSVLKSHNAKTEEIVEVNDRYIIAAYYPKNLGSGLEKTIRTELQQEIDAYKEENIDYVVSDKSNRLVLQIDFEEIVSGDYHSYIFKTMEGKSIYLLKDRNSFSHVYNSASKKEVVLDDLFKDEYLKQLSSLVRKNIDHSEYADKKVTDKYNAKTIAKPENFKDFIIVDNSLRIYFDSRDILRENIGVIYTDVDIEKMNYYLKTTINVANPVDPTDSTKNNLRYIDATKPMIALTYDDGPYGPVTSRILDALEKVQGTATFFVVGERVNWSVNEGMIERAYEMGCEIGNHTYEHLNLTKLSDEEILEQIDKTIREIQEVLPDFRLTAVRPVGGNYDDHVKNVVKYVMYNWNLDSLDWKNKDADMVYTKVMDYIEDGDIVLMHDLYASTAEASERLIAELSETYQLVTVSELMEYKGASVKPGDVVSSPTRIK